MQMHVAHHGPGLEAIPGNLRTRLVEQALQIQRIGGHQELAVSHPPLLTRPIAVDLDAEPVGIVEIQRFADEVIRCPGHRPALVRQTPQRAAERGSRRDEDGEMIETGASAGLGNRTLVLVQLEQRAAAFGAKNRRAAGAFRFMKAKHVAIEQHRAIEIANGEAHLPDVRV